MIETRQILEEFRLKNVLATSATGAVFLAEDPGTGREVVIKLVSCSVPDAEDRIRKLFLSMVEAARAGNVPAMPRLIDHGLTPEGDGFLVMEYLEGQTLDAVEDLSPAAALNVIIDVLGCVEGLARAGTAHLNLSSANVFVTHPPANDRAVVLGFGSSATLLHAGAGVPVPAVDPHLAPELVAGIARPGDQAWRSDLFSLGVIACGALGAEIEGNGYDRPRISLPPAVRTQLGEVEPLEAILGQIMEPDPKQRGGSPSEVRDSLIRALPDMPAPPIAAEMPRGDSFDANRTDPAFEAPPPAAAGPVVGAPAVGSQVPGPDADGVITDAGDDAEVDGHGWPEILFDDPELPESLDDLEDTDVRNPVPEDVWVPAPAHGDAPEAVATANGPAVPSAGEARRVPKWELALVAVVVVVLGSIIALTWPRAVGDREPVVASMQLEPVAAKEPLVPPPPDDNLFDDLLAIQHLVETGDVVAARSALDAFEERDDVSFSSDEAALYDSLVAALTRAVDRETAVGDVRSGLDSGSVKRIRRGLAVLSGLSREEISEIDGLARDLERARTVVRLHGAMWKAHGEGDHLGTMESAARLMQVLPDYSGSADLRRQSAADLEARAEGFIVSHEYAKAVAVLESLLEVWPDRAGPEARIAWCREQIEAARRDETAIARAVAKGDAGDPEAGLAALAEVQPDPRLQDDVERARRRLEARLAELDANAPNIEIAAAEAFGFKKNESVTVPLSVSDDHRVDRVVVHARNESDDGYLQIPLEPASDGLYNFVVTPELHGNQDVYFYVVARDASGHLGRLGAQDAPLKIQRKKWFKKILK